MLQRDPPTTRKLTIIAKDPGMRLAGPTSPMAFTQVTVPAEFLAKGPAGYRIKVVDYNATERRAYLDRQDYQDENGNLLAPFACQEGETQTDPEYQARLLGDPNFHAQNVYAIAMRTLGAFERALGRRVGWSSGGHQLHIAPHAFAQANAFYSEPDRSLLFGYFFSDDGSPIFTALSHDIVAHEATHALLDGLRSRFSEPSGPDQSAFHEGFSDIVALLSTFSLKPVVAMAIGEDGSLVENGQTIRLVDPAKLSPKAITNSILLGLAREVGENLGSDARGALRRSASISPAQGKKMRDSEHEHDRGEVIVAAMLSSFINLWSNRIKRLGKFEGNRYDLDAVVDEGAKLAGHLLNMTIRAIDYCPPTDIDFGQYLASLLTADRELVPEDTFGYRSTIRKKFRAYGIVSPRGHCDREGCWKPYATPSELIYARSNFAAMTRNKDEFFRFLWENRDALGVNQRAYSEVLSIDTASRIGPDGLAMHETVCQYAERVDIFGSEFESVLGAKRPDGMKTTDRFTAYGGGVVVLDQYGLVKYHISNPVMDGDRQFRRAQYFLDHGPLDGSSEPDRLQFAAVHLERMGA